MIFKSSNLLKVALIFGAFLLVFVWLGWNLMFRSVDLKMTRDRRGQYEPDTLALIFSGLGTWFMGRELLDCIGDRQARRRRRIKKAKAKLSGEKAPSPDQDLPEP